MQDVQALHSSNSGSHREAHGIAQRFLCAYSAFLDRLTVSAQGLHAQRSNAAANQLRQDLNFKAMKVCVKRIQRHLHCVKREIRLEHTQVNGWIFMAGKTEETNFSLLFRFQ